MESSFAPALEPQGAEQTPRTSRLENAWQQRLLPLMCGSLALLTMFFCVALAIETISVQRHIESAHELNLDPLIARLESVKPSNAAAVEEFRVKAVMLMEANVIDRRYHQASAAALGRIYLIFLGFATGMVLALTGSTFVLGKLREAPTTVGGGTSTLSANLRSGSPGLVLAFFGTVLMLSTIFSRADISVRDQALYVLPGQQAAEVVSGGAATPAKSLSDIAKQIEDGAKKDEGAKK
jgi:hypothetical protein